MADEYISKSKIAIEAQKLSTHPLNEWDTMGVLALIDRQPAADVAPVIHAHWVWGETERDRPFCSNCLDDAFWDNDHGFVTESFCPNCGAEMGESEDKE